MSEKNLTTIDFSQENSLSTLSRVEYVNLTNIVLHRSTSAKSEIK